MEKAVTDMKRSPTFCACMGTNTVAGDFGGELIMPDYYPEIRKIVTVRASVLPDSKYIHQNELEMGGALCFSVLYIGDDQTLSCIPYVAEYSQVMTLLGEGMSADCISVESIAENVSARPLGPRKISLKARVKSRVYFDRYEAYQPQITCLDRTPLDAARRRSIEKLEKKIPCTEKKIYTLTGSIKGELETEGIMKPVMCYGDILICETRSDSKVLTVKGEAALSAVVQVADGTYKTLCHSIPFEERIDGDTLTKSTRAAVLARLASASVTLDDDKRPLFFEVEYDLDAYTANESSITYIDDSYSREYEMEKVHREIKSQSILCASNAVIPLSCEGRRRSAGAECDFIISCMADAQIERADCLGDKVSISGLCNFSAYIASGGEVVTEEFSSAFSVEVPIPEGRTASDICYHAKAGVSGCNCTVKDQRLRADCRIALSFMAFSVDTVYPLWEATVGEKTKSQSGDCMIRVCYPEKGRRIWDIAKEYRANTSVCERLNKKGRTDICDDSPVIIRS